MNDVSKRSKFDAHVPVECTKFSDARGAFHDNLQAAQAANARYALIDGLRSNCAYSLDTEDLADLLIAHAEQITHLLSHHIKEK